MLIAIPSKGRAGVARTPQYLPSATFYVPETEADAYRSCYPNRVIAVPESIRGITATRNYILDNAETDRVVMIDDDVQSAGWVKLGSRCSWTRKITHEEAWDAEFRKLFEVAEGAGFPIWGVATQHATRSVYPYKPFLWRSYVTASCMGIDRSSGLRFDPEFIVKEDYEICLRCIRDFGGVVAARYLYWQNSHWKDDGGCKEYRTQAVERSAIEGLQRLYPGMVRQITRGGSEFSIELIL